jgi:chorismate--pyruvate lyase
MTLENSSRQAAPQAKTVCTRPLLWQPCTRFAAAKPQALIQSWLQDKGSLTARLVAASEGTFSLKLLRQEIMRPRLDEQRLLGLARAEVAIIREVVLYGDHQPWVFARSVLPLRSLTGNLRQLRKPSKRPLGAFLFRKRQLVRGRIHIAQISSRHGYVAAHLIGDKPLWGRRSVFSLQQRPLLVSEVFLPAFSWPNAEC